MSRTRAVRDRAAKYRGIEDPVASVTYTLTVTWPGGRTTQMRRKARGEARELAEDTELKGARIKVIEWRGPLFKQLADLNAFAKRPGLPTAATLEDKVAAVKADLARLAEQTEGRKALQ